MKSSYTSRAFKMLKQIAPYLEGCSTIEDYEYAVQNFNVEHHRNVQMANGISRIALIISDYVIKFDYGECGDYAGNCASEMKFYEFACERGFEYLFAAIEKCSVSGRDFYIMPRVYGIGRKYGHYAGEYIRDCEARDFVDYYCDDLHWDNFGWKDHHVMIVDYAWNSIREA